MLTSVAKVIARRNFSTSKFAAAQQMTVRDALNSALDEEMRRDKRVIIIGEDKVSKALRKKYGHHRVIDMPITGKGPIGIAIGASMIGLRPVCEFMMYEFSIQDIDQMIISAKNSSYMSAHKVNVPIVFRGRKGAAAGDAAQDSQCSDEWYSDCPRLQVISPYTAEDARGLLKAAIRDPDPVVLLENEMLYDVNFPVSDEVLSKNFVVPIGKAKIERNGKHITIVSHSKALEQALEAADELAGKGIEAEVVNLRSLRPLDVETIFKSVSKTHHLITVELGSPQCVIGSEICATIRESPIFYELDTQFIRVTGVDGTVPNTQSLELKAVAPPRKEHVVMAVNKILGVTE